MRRKKTTTTLVFLLVCVTTLVSCSDMEDFFRNIGNNTLAAPQEDDTYLYQEIEIPEDLELYEPTPIEARTLSDLEMRILQLELLVHSDGTAENHFHLALLYEEAGMIRNHRDALERSYRLDKNEEVFAKLQGVVVNVYEESSIIQELTRSLKRYLSNESHHANAVELILSEEWFGVMMPNLLEGRRNYYLEDISDGSILFVEVGYDAQNDNMPYTRVWHYTPANDDVVNLFQSGNMFQLVQTSLVNGYFDGEFSVWLCVVNGDTIHHDTGTFSRGIIVGEFVSKVHSVSERSDLVSLFNSRNYVEYEVFLGNFNQYGETIITQPRGVTDSQIAYALSEDGRKFLFYTVSEDEDRDGVVFDFSFFGLIVFPDFETYTPVPVEELQGIVTLDLSGLRIRVFDSIIQWFDGETWHNVGNVRDLIAQDPYRSDLITLSNITGFGNIVQTSENGGISSLLINRGGVSEVPAAQPPRAPQTSSNQGSGGGGSGGGTTTPPEPPQPPPLPPGSGGDDDGWSDIHP